MTLQDFLFSCLGLICAGSAVLAVTTRQIVHAALWLTTCLAALSGCYLVLGAELVALVQMLVYVGAVVVLVLFAIMLTRAPIGRSADHDVSMMHRMVAFVVAAATGGLMLAAFVAAFGSRTVHLHASSTHTLAVNLFGRFTWPFEALSLVLLAALVGALAMMGLRNAQENAVGTAAEMTPTRPARGARRVAGTPEGTTAETGGTADGPEEPRPSKTGAKAASKNDRTSPRPDGGKR